MPAFDTSIRDRALKERREHLEDERRRLIYAVAETLRRNRQKYNIREAYITGSLLQSYRWYHLFVNLYYHGLLRCYYGTRDIGFSVINTDRSPHREMNC